MKNPKKPRPAAPGANLSEDLVDFGILPHLPAKSLTRFKSVSKKWRRFISNPTPLFVHLQNLHAPSFLLEFWSAPSRYISSNPLSDGIPCLDTFYTRSQTAKIVASCSGLLCILRDWHGSQKLYIGNPSLKAWKVIPYPDFALRYRTAFGLALLLCECSVRYRLVMVAIGEMESKVDGDVGSFTRVYEFHVFCSVLGRWNVAGKTLVLPARSVIGAVAVYAEGSLFWVFQKDGCVLRFNVETEISSLQALPSGAEENPWHGNIGVCGGKFSYGMIVDIEIQIWFLDKLEWSKMFSISLGCCALGAKLEALAPFKNVRFMPFEGGDFLTFSLEKVIYSYNTLTCEFQKQIAPYAIFPWFPYKEYHCFAIQRQ